MWEKVGPKNRRKPLLLRPDNFTPPERTPWGGRRIVRDLKRELGLEVNAVVGEAWELSVEPDFPSKTIEGSDLDPIIRADPSAWLGREAGLRSTALLVKLLDAADDLSVQIHPDDSDPELEADQGGKREAWYILEAEAGSGLYLGFRKGVQPEDVRLAIENERNVSDLMYFVPVSEGDLFLIDPGTAHSVGRGVMLLEPQRVLPGKRGITYRYWDWNRKYDRAGVRSERGLPRALHLDRALAVTDWTGPREDALLDRIRHRAGRSDPGAAATTETLISDAGPLRSSVFHATRLCGTGVLELAPVDALRALVVLQGQVRLEAEGEVVEVRQGQTAAVPACFGRSLATVEATHAVLLHLA